MTIKYLADGSVDIQYSMVDGRDHGFYKVTLDLADALNAANRRNVPREPTQEMLIAAGRNCIYEWPADEARLKLIWQAMYAAAPPHSDDARDAARYRWLRVRNEGIDVDPSGPFAVIDQASYPTGEQLDAAIDAAMGGKAGG